MNYRASRAAAHRTASSMSEADVVSAAEEIVRSARGREMYWALDHAESAVRESYRDWDTACRCLVAAQRGGDPTQISTAHVALEQSLENARRNVALRDRLLMALRGPRADDLLRQVGVSGIRAPAVPWHVAAWRLVRRMFGTGAQTAA